MSSWSSNQPMRELVRRGEEGEREEGEGGSRKGEGGGREELVAKIPHQSVLCLPPHLFKLLLGKTGLHHSVIKLLITKPVKEHHTQGG